LQGALLQAECKMATQVQAYVTYGLHVVEARVTHRALSESMLSELLPQLIHIYRGLHDQPDNTVVVHYNFSASVDAFVNVIDVHAFAKRFATFCDEWEPLTRRVSRCAIVQCPPGYAKIASWVSHCMRTPTVPMHFVETAAEVKKILRRA
jgi:hypothetical protein